MGIDSRASTLDLNARSYLTSASRQSDWGQQPASGYYFSTDGDHLTGFPLVATYVPTSDPDIDSTEETRLLLETAAWEAASDADLMRFENQLDT